MKKIIKTILIISIAVFGAGFLSAPFASATQVDTLVVEFEKTPLFGEGDFKPGDNVVRWIKVTNNTAETQRIATEAINKSDPDNLASQLNLTIKEGVTIIFNNTLSQFFSQGETYLSDLAGNGGQTQYDFAIAFNSGAGNDYQGKTLGFDIIVGFEGSEGGLTPLSPGQGMASAGNGPLGGLPPGLTIQNEANIQIAIDSVTITWDTSYLATSQVIYALDSEAHILNLLDNTGSPPKYGYQRTTPEYDTSSKVLHHAVIISGLAPGTTYYYRAVSHGSLAISTEHSFTTLTPEETVAAAVIAEAAERALSAAPAAVSPEGVNGVNEEGGITEIIETPGEIPEEEFVPLGITAAIGMIWKDISQSIFKSIIVILAIIILIFLISKEISRKRKNH